MEKFDRGLLANLSYERLLANRGMFKMNYINCMTLIRVVTKQKKWSDVTHPYLQERPQKRDNQDLSKEIYHRLLMTHKMFSLTTSHANS